MSWIILAIVFIILLALVSWIIATTAKIRDEEKNDFEDDYKGRHFKM